MAFLKETRIFLQKFLEKVTDHRGNSLQMERFLEFFGGIWEKVHRTWNTMEMPWI